MRKLLFVLLWAAGAVIASGVATEVFAVLARGVPFLDSPPPLFGSFHYPWSLFVWYALWDVSGNSYLIAFVIFGVLITIDAAIVLRAYVKRSSPKTSGDFGTSRWMKPTELRRSELFHHRGVVLAQTNNATWKKSRKGAYRQTRVGKLLVSKEPAHYLVVASTRKGKGINTVIPTLLRWDESVIVYDIKKENWIATSGFRRRFSHTLRFEPTDPTTVRYNPLLEVKHGPDGIADATNLAELIGDPSGKGDSGSSNADFFDNTAKRLLSAAIIHVLYARETKTLAEVYSLLNDPERTFPDTLSHMLEYDHGDPAINTFVHQEARGALNQSENLLASVQTTISTMLRIFQDPQIAAATSASDFRIRDLMDADRPTSLYMVFSPNDAVRLRPLIRLMFAQFGNRLTQDFTTRHHHKLLMLIDEFPSLGRMEFLETQLAYFAGYGIHAVLITQSYAQLYKHYTRETSIPANCKYHVVLGTNEAKEGQLIADALGKRTTRKQSESKSAAYSTLLARNRSVSESETGVHLVQPDEILRLPFEDVILVIGGSYPYKASKVMYFADNRFLKYANLPVPESRREQEALLPPQVPTVWETLGRRQGSEYVPSERATGPLTASDVPPDHSGSPAPPVDSEPSESATDEPSTIADHDETVSVSLDDDDSPETLDTDGSDHPPVSRPMDLLDL